MHHDEKRYHAFAIIRRMDRELYRRLKARAPSWTAGWLMLFTRRSNAGWNRVINWSTPRLTPTTYERMKPVLLAEHRGITPFFLGKVRRCF